MARMALRSISKPSTIMQAQSNICNRQYPSSGLVLQADAVVSSGETASVAVAVPEGDEEDCDDDSIA